tara:strand:+ start:1113 stop:1412 length:300 start_codon:yes stop_codon:yes gene_type:complete
MAIQPKKNIPSPSKIKNSPRSFSEQELNQLKELRTKLGNITIQLGQLQLTKIRLKNQEEEIKKEIILLEKEESTLAKNLSNKYGDGKIDLESGTFTPSK